jgi:hypothetical protein
MDVNKLRFDELFKLEQKAAKSLIEALVEIRGKCKNPAGNGKHDCANCIFEIRQNCGKLILDDWLNILGEKV